MTFKEMLGEETKEIDIQTRLGVLEAIVTREYLDNSATSIIELDFSSLLDTIVHEYVRKEMPLDTFTFYVERVSRLREMWLKLNN